MSNLKTVWVVHYTTRHGDDVVTAYEDQADALAVPADIAREFWHDAVQAASQGEGPDVKLPATPDDLDDAAAAKAYFEALDDERIAVFNIPVEPKRRRKP